MEQLHAGDALGHYRILETLGKGGMGEVYAAEDTKLHRKVALKVIPAVFATDLDRRRRFEREAQTIAALNHPGIVTVYSVEADGPVPFLTMELVEGRPLRDVIEKGGMALDSLLRCGIAMTDAIAAAHQRGIVHRDLKPANVMVPSDGRVKVLDFGLAKIHELEAAAAGESSTHLPNDDLTGEGRIVGTVAYMSPEQAEGKTVDQRSDIFSLGVILHEMATGERPFKGDTEVSLISSIIKDTPAAVTDSRPELPLQLARIVKRCLIKDPQRRYQSARDLHTDLEDLKQDVDSGVLSNPSGMRASSDSSARAFRVPKGVAYGLAAGLAALATVGTWLTIAKRLSAPRVFEAGTFERMTDSGTVFSMEVSPDGRYVAYGQKSGTGSEIWIRQAAVGSNVRIVPPTDGRMGGLAFSPDGNFVLYSRYPRGSNIATLYKVPALGGDAIPVLEDIDSGISFSPDGARFSFLRGREMQGKMELMTANADGSSVSSVAVSSPPKMFFSQRAPWSPDGRTLMASAHLGLGGKESLEAVDLATHTRTPFGGDWADVEGVAWMPDGKSVLIVGADKNSTHVQLWQVDWPGGGRRQVTSGLNDYEAVGLSADGRTVAAIETEYRSNIWVQDLAAGPARPITSNVRGSIGDAGIAWTPDGRLVYSSMIENGSLQLWMMNGDGTHAHQLTSRPGATPAVSPDGQWIYFSSSFANMDHGESAIWRLPLEGGEPTQVTTGVTERQSRPVISADGKWLFFTSGDGARFRAMKVAADGGEGKELTRPEFSFRVDQVTPDGSRLFGFAVDPSHPQRGSRPAIVSVDGGVPDFPDNLQHFGRLVPDGTSIVYEDQRNGKTSLFLRPLAGGTERQLVDLGQDSVVWRIAVTTDGKTLAFVRGRETSDVVLIKAK